MRSGPCYTRGGNSIAALRPIPWRTGHQTVYDPLLVATGLYSPGAGVGLVAWLAQFDGRVPGRTIAWWAFLFNARCRRRHMCPISSGGIYRRRNWWGLPASNSSLCDCLCRPELQHDRSRYVVRKEDINLGHPGAERRRPRRWLRPRSQRGRRNSVSPTTGPNLSGWLHHRSWFVWICVSCPQQCRRCAASNRT